MRSPFSSWKLSICCFGMLTLFFRSDILYCSRHSKNTIDSLVSNRQFTLFQSYIHEFRAQVRSLSSKKFNVFFFFLSRSSFDERSGVFSLSDSCVAFWSTRVVFTSLDAARKIIHSRAPTSNDHVDFFPFISKSNLGRFYIQNSPDRCE